MITEDGGMKVQISLRLFDRAAADRAYCHNYPGVNQTQTPTALVYDILPSTTAVFSYAIGSRKLSANEQLFCWCSNSSKFVTNNSNKTRRVIYIRQQSLHQHKQNHNCLNRDGTLFFVFNPGGCVSCLRACFGARLLQQSY